MADKRTDEHGDVNDPPKDSRFGGFGDPSALLNAGDEDDWGIPSLTFPSIGDTDDTDDTDSTDSASSASQQQSDSARESRESQKSRKSRKPVPAPQATATSETTVLRPLDSDSHDTDQSADQTAHARSAQDEATVVIAPEPDDDTYATLGIVADEPSRAGEGLRAIIEGMDDESGEPDHGPSATSRETHADAATDGTSMPHATDAASSAAGATRPATRRRLAAIAVAAFVAAAAVTGVVAFAHARSADERQARFDTALAACRNAADDATKAHDSLDAALSKAKKARAISADQLADPSTLTKLADAIDAVQDASSPQTCSVKLAADELDAHAARNTKLAGTFASDEKTLVSATKAVTDSQAKKTQEDAATDESAQDGQEYSGTSDGSTGDSYGYADGYGNANGYGTNGYGGYGNGYYYGNGGYGYGNYGYGTDSGSGTGGTSGSDGTSTSGGAGTTGKNDGTGTSGSGATQQGSNGTQGSGGTGTSGSNGSTGGTSAGTR